MAGTCQHQVISRYLSGVWQVPIRKVAGACPVCDRYMSGMWQVWYVAGTCHLCDRYLVGMWQAGTFQVCSRYSCQVFDRYMPVSGIWQAGTCQICGSGSRYLSGV